MAMIDYSALLYDPVYAEIGVPAMLNAGTAGEIDLTVIDKTRRKSNTTNTDSGGIEVRSVGPSANARMPELAAKGITRDDLKGSVLTFNGRSWIVRSHELTGNPNGEDLGEILFLLMPNNG
jgi:hypothetical protein